MKLILKMKLLPTDEQANLLLETMKEANAVCNAEFSSNFKFSFSNIIYFKFEV